MKVNIWIHKNDIINGTIDKYYLWRPQISGYDNYVQVTITSDEFTRLEDNNKIKDWKDEIVESGRSEDNYPWETFKKEHNDKKEKTK